MVLLKVLLDSASAGAYLPERRSFFDTGRSFPYGGGFLTCWSILATFVLSAESWAGLRLGSSAKLDPLRRIAERLSGMVGASRTWTGAPATGTFGSRGSVILIASGKKSDTCSDVFFSHAELLQINYGRKAGT